MVMIFSGSIHKENIMTISKTKNGTYRLKIYIPIEARMPLGIVNSNYYDCRDRNNTNKRCFINNYKNIWSIFGQNFLNLFSSLFNHQTSNCIIFFINHLLQYMTISLDKLLNIFMTHQLCNYPYINSLSQ